MIVAGKACTRLSCTDEIQHTWWMRFTRITGAGMHIFYQSSAKHFSLTTRIKRWLSLSFVISTVVLTGCANQSSQKSASSGDVYSFGYDWRHSNDPIGDLLARHQRGTLKVGINDEHPMAMTAMDYLGIRYRYGGNSPTTGFDCSGFVNYVANKSLGLKLPRRSDEMAQLGVSIKKSELQVGDLVFFNTLGRRFSHVGVYIGDDRFVHSPAAGGVVRVEDMNAAYWTKRFTGARRLDPTMLASR